jgi:hypothetical protein
VQLCGEIETAMPGIFISYRRDDSQGFAGRLADDLSDILGADRVFRDIEIPVGSDFTEVLRRAIAASDLLLVVIGRRWADPSAEGCGSRLFEPADWVRAEIEAAFAQGKQVVPVLVGGAWMPQSADLPSSLRRLCVLQAAVMTDRHWDTEVRDLVGRLQVLCPMLAGAPTRAEKQAESPADVMREMSERLLEEVTSRRSTRYRSHVYPGILQRLLRQFGRGIRRFLGSAVVVVLIYIAMRLFGDQELLDMLDAFEARLQTAWVRLQAYVSRL